MYMIVYVYYIFVGLVNGKTIQETPIFDGKIQWFPVDVPLNQSMDIHIHNTHACIGPGCSNETSTSPSLQASSCSARSRKECWST